MIAPKIEVDSFWLPRQSSTLAPSIDHAWSLVLWISVGFFTLIVGAMIYFLIRYRRRTAHDVTSEVSHSTKLEITWTAIPLVIVIGLAFVGLTGYVSAAVAPAEAYEIQVTAQKWSWQFTYPNGTISPNKLVIPRGRPVKLVMSSRDIVHSLFIPEFRIKQDVVPGAYTTIWFEGTDVKETAILCTEYCGAGHSDMMATVSVMEQRAFDAWLESGGEDKSLPPAEYGKQLFSSWNCGTCHSLDGSAKQGPSLEGIFGRNESLADGSTVKVDETYLRDSILISNKQVVAGFQPVMPVFQGQLKDRQVDALIAFLKEQK